MNSIVTKYIHLPYQERRRDWPDDARQPLIMSMHEQKGANSCKTCTMVLTDEEENGYVRKLFLREEFFCCICKRGGVNKRTINYFYKRIFVNGIEKIGKKPYIT